MGRGAFSSHSRYHLPKKRTNVSSQNPTLQTPSSPKHPGTDAREDPPHQKPSEITVEHAHKALLPPTKSEHDATLRTLLGSFRHEASTSVSSARRRRHGVGRVQQFTDPSPGTIPQICSPSPALAASCPPPFRFAQEPWFFEDVVDASTKRSDGEGAVSLNANQVLMLHDRRTRGAVVRKFQGVGNSTFVLSVGNDNDFRSRCE
jgi:hypothetical protein